MMTGALVPADGGESVGRGGRGRRIVLGGAQAGGNVAVSRTAMPGGTCGLPLHRHPESDELFLVPAGMPVVQVGAATDRVEAGGGVFVPRGVARAFATAPGADVAFPAARLPGGFEDFRRKVARVGQESATTPAPLQRMQIGTCYDRELAGPPMFVDSPRPTPMAAER